MTRLLRSGMPLIPCGLCQARDNPVRPTIRKLRTLGLDMVETTPVVFRNG